MTSLSDPHHQLTVCHQAKDLTDGATPFCVTMMLPFPTTPGVSLTAIWSTPAPL